MKLITWQHKPKRSFWFRIFGYGLNIINRDLYPAPFSIRYGHRKELRIGKFGLHFLYKNKIHGGNHAPTNRQ